MIDSLLNAEEILINIKYVFNNSLQAYVCVCIFVCMCVCMRVFTYVYTYVIYL